MTFRSKKMKNISLRRSVLLTVFAALAVGLGAACDPKVDDKKPVVNATPATPATPAAVPAVSPAAPTDPKAAVGADKLVGKWDGPEGTFIDVTKKDGKYSVAIKDLDKTETFEGTVKGDTIEFTRKGKAETVKAASGVETGMKGFEKETNCVVVTKGSEGFCRKAAAK